MRNKYLFVIKFCAAHRPETTEKSAVRRYNLIMVLYIDVYFLENLIFDFFIVLLAERISGGRIRIIRCLSAALFGAGYAVFAAIFAAFDSLLPRALALILMTWAADGFYSVKAFLRQFAVFFLAFAVSGGAAYALALFSGGGHISGSVIYFDKPILLSGAGIALSGTAFLIAESKMGRARRSEYIKLAVLKGGEVYRFTALYDSGNRAIDPVTGLSVIIAEDIFPEKVKTGAHSFSIKTASGTAELSLFVPDRVVFSESGSYFAGDAAIGITKERLSENGSFNALIGGAFFERIKSNTGVFEEHIL